jgi:hypothetical protein
MTRVLKLDDPYSREHLGNAHSDVERSTSQRARKCRIRVHCSQMQLHTIYHDSKANAITHSVSRCSNTGYEFNHTMEFRCSGKYSANTFRIWAVRGSAQCAKYAEIDARQFPASGRSCSADGE